MYIVQAHLVVSLRSSASSSVLPVDMTPLLLRFGPALSRHAENMHYWSQILKILRPASFADSFSLAVCVV